MPDTAKMYVSSSAVVVPLDVELPPPRLPVLLLFDDDDDDDVVEVEVLIVPPPPVVLFVSVTPFVEPELLELPAAAMLCKSCTAFVKIDTQRSRSRSVAAYAIRAAVDVFTSKAFGLTLEFLAVLVGSRTSEPRNCPSGFL